MEKSDYIIRADTHFLPHLPVKYVLINSSMNIICQEAQQIQQHYNGRQELPLVTGMQQRDKLVSSQLSKLLPAVKCGFCSLTQLRLGPQ